VTVSGRVKGTIRAVRVKLQNGGAVQGRVDAPMSLNKRQGYGLRPDPLGYDALGLANVSGTEFIDGG
jgi:cytoskeletal protein CcmA (bactofilin family)